MAVIEKSTIGPRKSMVPTHRTDRQTENLGGLESRGMYGAFIFRMVRREE